MLDSNENVPSAPEAGSLPASIDEPSSRRSFLRWSGAGAAALVAAACDRPTRTITGTEIQTDTILRVDTVAPVMPTYAAVTLNLSDDFGALNYAFALEQLEAAFYTQVVATPFSGISDEERRVLTDLRDHEVVHRDFLAAAIPALGGTAIPGLTPNFTSINFGDRFSVLTAARNFEDLGVGAYNGAGQFLQSAALLTVAGKIVSVEARHAAAIRDLLNRRSGDFAPQAFDNALRPQQVLATAAPFIRNSITLANVPTSFVSVNRQS